MFSSVVSAGTVFTPGDGTGSVVFYWGTMAGVTLGSILATIAFLMFMVAVDIEQYEERMKVGKFCFIFFIAAMLCFMVSSVCYRHSLPGESTVEGTVVRVMDTGSDGAELLFDDGLSVSMYKSANKLKDIQGLRVRLSCDSNKSTNDSIDDIYKCKYKGVIATPSHTPSKSSGTTARQKHKPSWRN